MPIIRMEPTARKRRVRNRQAVTLVEIMVAVVLMVSFTAAAWFFFASTRASDRDSEREQTYLQRRAILEGQVRNDLRTATDFQQISAHHWKLRVLFLDDHGQPGEQGVEYRYDPEGIRVIRSVDGREQSHEFADCSPDGTFRFELRPVHP